MPNNLYRQCPENHYPYIIQPGDTLNRIASRLEVGLSRILAANPGIDPYNLRIGQTICIPACLPNHIARIIRPGDTLYRIAQEYNVSIASILQANPGIDPNYLRVGQRICIPLPGDSACRITIDAMQRDINMLKAESPVQQTQESNYGSSTQRTLATGVTAGSIRFAASPVSFSGDYRGHFTQGQSYSYFIDAAMGGRRSINVRDNFGVWHSFGYQVPVPQ
jgi:LysM repeat protein